MPDAIGDVLQEKPAAAPAAAPPKVATAPVTFSSKRFVLLGLAEKAGAVVPPRDGPLSCLRVRVSPEEIEFTGTDLELTLIVRNLAVSATEKITAYFPSARLTAVLREAAEGDVQVVITGRSAKITAGSASWVIQLSDGRDYPEIPAAPAPEHEHTVDREAFLGAIRAVRYAVGHDGSRANLMLVDIRDGKVTGCDGSRCQRVPLPGFPLDMQIPAAGNPTAADQLVRLLGGSDMATVIVAETERSLVFRVGSSVLFVQKFAAKFADVEKLLLRPAMENTLPLRVSRKDLLAAIRRVRISADPDTSAIALRIAKNLVTVEAKDGANVAKEPVTASWDEPERLVAVNHRFLTEMLTAQQGDECLFMLGPDTARKRSMVMVRDEKTGAQAVIIQMLRSMLGT